MKTLDVSLNLFKPRDYQKGLFDAIENKGYKQAIIIAPRRCGKDLAAYQLLMRQALQHKGIYLYVGTTYKAIRNIIWDAMTNDGIKVIDYIPKELVESKNQQTMTIILKNGSQIQCVGAKEWDGSIVGRNCRGFVFTEYAQHNPMAYQQGALPILRGNGGWIVFVSTPRGHNHMYDLWKIAQKNPDKWYSQLLTVEDTKHISVQQIEDDIANGQISSDMAKQEYWCSFDFGALGSFYSAYLDSMRQNDQIGLIPWDSGLKVHTAWDLGYDDANAILWYQVLPTGAIHIIDSYENNKKSMAHYIDIVKSKPYSYGKHFAPSDIAVHEYSTGEQRFDLAESLGLKFETEWRGNKRVSSVPKDSIAGGIERVRCSLSKIYINQGTCEKLIRSLENYRQEYDEEKGVYNATPVHDHFSHMCFTGDTLVLTRSGMRQIMDIEQDEEVLTLSGWKRCTKAQLIRKNAPLVEVKFQDGTIVKCTPDHMFLTENGWRSAESLEKGSMIQSSLMSELNISMDHCLNSLKVKDIILDRGGKGYIGKYGVRLLERFRKIATFITKILKLQTTGLGISNVCIGKNIFLLLKRALKVLVLRLERLLQNGIDHLLVLHGINDTPRMYNWERSLLESPETVSIVESNFNHLSVQEEPNTSSATVTAKLLLLEGVERLEEKADVYCIGVPEVGHFSLSNGAIVKNCDALRYLCLALPKVQDTMTAEQLEQNYKQARYGNIRNLPPQFMTR